MYSLLAVYLNVYGQNSIKKRMKVLQIKGWKMKETSEDFENILKRFLNLKTPYIYPLLAAHLNLYMLGFHWKWASTEYGPAVSVYTSFKIFSIIMSFILSYHMPLYLWRVHNGHRNSPEFAHFGSFLEKNDTERDTATVDESS